MTEINKITNKNNYQMNFEGKKMPEPEFFEKKLKSMLENLYGRINPEIKKVYPEENSFAETFLIGKKKYGLELKKISDNPDSKHVFVISYSNPENGIRNAMRNIEFPENSNVAAKMLKNEDFASELLSQFNDLEKVSGFVNEG